MSDYIGFCVMRELTGRKRRKATAAVKPSEYAEGTYRTFDE